MFKVTDGYKCDDTRDGLRGGLEGKPKKWWIAHPFCVCIYTEHVTSK